MRALPEPAFRKNLGIVPRGRLRVAGFVGGGRDNGGVTETAPASAPASAPAPGLAVVDRLLAQAFDALAVVAESGSDAELVGVVTRCEAAVRRLDRCAVAAVAGLERRGVFTERGYKSPAAAVADLIGCERFEARRRVVAAEQVTARVGLDGVVLPARLPATAAVFAGGRRVCGTSRRSLGCSTVPRRGG